MIGPKKEVHRMVNTRVKDPLRRRINRTLGRQKKAMMRQNERILRDPLDSDASCRVEIHKLKITEKKLAREQLNANQAHSKDEHDKE